MKSSEPPKDESRNEESKHTDLPNNGFDMTTNESLSQSKLEMQEQAENAELQSPSDHGRTSNEVSTKWPEGDSEGKNGEGTLTKTGKKKPLRDEC